MKKTKQEYAEKYKDPRWQKKRLEILERDEFTCQICGTKEETLHIHHTYYEKNKEPWEHSSEFLITLCSKCHKNDYDLLPTVIQELIVNIKKHFCCTDIMKISKGFKRIRIQHDHLITAATIEYVLSNPRVLDFLEHKKAEHILKTEKSRSYK